MGSPTVVNDTSTPGAYVDLALHEPTAREVASALLHGAARVRTRTDAPHGGRTVEDALVADPARPRARDVAVEPRDERSARIGDRFQRALEEGDLPPDADPDLLAQYLITVSDGIAVQAGDGLDADELHQVADVAVQAWASPWSDRR